MNIGFGVVLWGDVLIGTGAAIAGAIFCPPRWREWARSKLGLSA